MEFHHNGYVSEDPRVKPAAPGRSLDNPPADNVDVLIVGTGPAGIITAAQLSMFPAVTTRIIEKRGGRLELGHADGVAVRSIETFQAFGFATDIVEECFRIVQTAFWKPNPDKPGQIKRAAVTEDDAIGLSEFPHITVNQARVADYFIQFMKNSPTRMAPEYNLEFLDLTVHEGREYPVEVRVRNTVRNTESVINAKYVLGADGAHSQVRASIGRKLEGKQAMHAWGVLDAVVETDFPDFRTKAVIDSKAGSILWIPREGGYLTRIYVDLGEVPDGPNEVRKTPPEEVVRRANEILHPYTMEVRDLPWFSVYEVGHRITDKYDNVDDNSTPHVFIAGDACHTHSAKAGQGMNVSMQDGWNLAWKLGYVLSGWAPESLLATYDGERRAAGQALIDFDSQWSSLMAKGADEFDDPTEIERFYVDTWEFPSGMRTQYNPSMLTTSDKHQNLAKGYPIGKRFKSAVAVRKCDARPMHLGHLHEADGRYRIYAFADAPVPSDKNSKMTKFAEWLEHDPASPLQKYVAKGQDFVERFDVKAIYQQNVNDFEITDVPTVFRPVTGQCRTRDWELVFGKNLVREERRDYEADIFEWREVSRDGAVVIVRPDQYVAAVLPLDATDEVAAYFDGLLTQQ